MNADIREYARLGLVHHLLYPECAGDPDLHARTLLEFIRRGDIETFDCCLPAGGEHLERLAPAIRECGKTVCFAIHFYPLRSLPLAAAPEDAVRTWKILDAMIAQAAAIGAEGFIFGAGTPSYHDAAERDFEAFDRFCRELCGKLEPHGITALLEPFDTDVDKKFLYGPIDACVRLAERVRRDHGNFGFELDVAHLPLMREEFPSAIRRAGPYLQRVHLGNCVLKNPRDPRWGDTHPPIGYPGGEIDVPELAVILRSLVEAGFLDRKNRGNLLLEMTPFPGKSVEYTVRDGFSRLHRAWKEA